MTDYITKRGSVLEPLYVTLRSSDGSAVDLTSAQTVGLWVREPVSGQAIVSGAPMTILSPPTGGRVRYDWAPADVALFGLYFAELGVLWGTAQLQRFPADGYLVIDIQDDLESP